MSRADERDEPELDYTPVDLLVVRAPETDRAPRRSGGPVRPAHARLPASWVETYAPRGRR